MFGPFFCLSGEGGRCRAPPLSARNLKRDPQTAKPNFVYKQTANIFGSFLNSDRKSLKFFAKTTAKTTEKRLRYDKIAGRNRKCIFRFA